MLFNDVMLMYPGGLVVYFGPSHLMEDYFTCLGFFTPVGENPADFFLDVVSGVVPVLGDAAFNPSVLCNVWSDLVQAQTEVSLQPLRAVQRLVRPGSGAGCYGAVTRVLGHVAPSPPSLGSPGFLAGPPHGWHGPALGLHVAVCYCNPSTI
jgi:hypothetical protein